MHRTIQAPELSVLILVAAIVDAAAGGLPATRVLPEPSLAVGAVMVAAHLVAILASRRASDEALLRDPYDGGPAGGARPGHDSVFAQRGSDVELVVVGNGADVSGLPAGVKLIRLPENVGVAAGRNAGVEACGGDMVLFLDDDGWYPDTGLADYVSRRFGRIRRSRSCRCGSSTRRAGLVPAGTFRDCEPGIRSARRW